MEGVYAEHRIWCIAGVLPGRDDDAMSHADAWAFTSMTESQ
jgi:hypothetical protein